MGGGIVEHLADVLVRTECRRSQRLVDVTTVRGVSCGPDLLHGHTTTLPSTDRASCPRRLDSQASLPGHAQRCVAAALGVVRLCTGGAGPRDSTALAFRPSFYPAVPGLTPRL